MTDKDPPDWLKAPFPPPPRKDASGLILGIILAMLIAAAFYTAAQMGAAP